MLFAHLWLINKHRGSDDPTVLHRQNTAHACISICPGHSQTEPPLAAEVMYISLIHSSDLPGGCLSSDMPLNPKITLRCRLGCHSGKDVRVAGSLLEYHRLIPSAFVCTPVCESRHSNRHIHPAQLDQVFGCMIRVDPLPGSAPGGRELLQDQEEK